MKTKQLDLSNGYNAINFADSIIALALGILVYAIPAIIFGTTINWLILAVCAILAIALPLTCDCQNKYIINGNYIQIKEYFLCVKTLDINIDISQIERIESKKFIPIINRDTCFFIGSTKYTLRCTTHRNELVKSIKQRMLQ